LEVRGVVTDQLLTVAEVAAALGVKRSTIYGWVDAGLIPHFKLGALLRFRQRDLEAWLEQNHRGPRLEATG
jgi:excisionase family DNA binding protein